MVVAQNIRDGCKHICFLLNYSTAIEETKIEFERFTVMTPCDEHVRQCS